MKELLPFVLHSYSYIVVIVNARPTEVAFACPALRAKTLKLHPIQVIRYFNV